MAEKKNKVFKRFVWKIPLRFNKQTYANFGSRRSFSSDPFKIELGDNIKTEWHLNFFPKFRHHGEDYVTLSKSLRKSNSEGYSVEWNTGIMGDKEEENFMSKGQSRSGWICDEELEFVSVPRDTKDLLINHNKLFDSEAIFNASNSYFFRLHVIFEITLTVRKPKVETIKDESEFKRMFENELFADFEIQTSSEEVLKASKSVLSAKSPVFFAMLTNDMQEARENIVSIPDFSSKIIRELLRFIYCEEVKNIEEIDSELIFAAEKYQLEELKEMCIDSMINTLSLENVIEYYATADLVSKGNRLQEHCIHKIAGNYPNIIVKDGWKQLRPELVSAVQEEVKDRRNNAIEITSSMY